MKRYRSKANRRRRFVYRDQHTAPALPASLKEAITRRDRTAKLDAYNPREALRRRAEKLLRMYEHGMLPPGLMHALDGVYPKLHLES